MNSYHRRLQSLLYTYAAHLEPFFRDVTTKVILRRLIYAVLPHSQRADELLNAPDLYGPLLLVLTQTQVLRVGMRYHNIHINEQALIASCLMLCLAYWALLSLALVVFGRAASGILKRSHGSAIPLSTAASIAGYALFGHLVVLLANHFSLVLFYPAFFTVGVGASMCLWVVLVRVLPTHSWVSPLAGGIGLLHLAWLWHLRSTYAV
jgi:hypothetical protein